MPWSRSSGQETQPTSHTQIVSRDELGIQPLPTLQLRLRNPSQATLSSRPRFMRGRYWKSLFYDAKDRFLSDKTDDEVNTSINVRRIEGLFDNMRDDLRRLCSDVKKEMEGMSLSEQRLVVEYWQQMQAFLIALLKWLQELFHKVLDEIKKGRRLNRSVLQDAFYDVFEALKRSLDDVTDEEDGERRGKKRNLDENAVSSTGEKSRSNVENSNHIYPSSMPGRAAAEYSYGRRERNQIEEDPADDFVKVQHYMV